MAIRKLAAAVNPTRAEQRVRQSDEAGAAHTANPATAYDGELNLAGLGIDGCAVHRAAVRAHAAADSAAFECRPGATGAGQRKVRSAQNDFAVGSQVHVEGHGIRRTREAGAHRPPGASGRRR